MSGTSETATQQSDEWTVARDGDGVCLIQGENFVHVPNSDVALARSRMRERQPSEVPAWLENFVFSFAPTWGTALGCFGLFAGILVGAVFTALLVGTGLTLTESAGVMVIMALLTPLAGWL